MIRITGLAAKYGDFTFSDLDLEVGEHEYFILLGPSGTGKTLLIETLAGLHPTRGGTVMVKGEDMSGQAPEKRGLGYVPQDYSLFPHLTVADNVGFGLNFSGLSSQEKELRVRETLVLLKIEGLRDRWPAEISGGERQRVALARALTIQPKVLLLDEPLAALDVEIRQRLWPELRNVKEELGLTVIHVTHDFEEAYTLGDRIGILMDGDVQQVGTPDEIFLRPKNIHVARFLGIRNIFEGTVVEYHPKTGEVLMPLWGKAVTAVSPRPLVEGARIRFCIRPEDVMIVREKRPLTSDLKENVFSGTVTGVSSRGGVNLVYVGVEGAAADEQSSHLEIQIPRHAAQRLRITSGMTVAVALKKKGLHIFG